MIIRIYLLSRMLHFWQIPTINICRSKFVCLMISFNCLIRTLREKCPSTDFFSRPHFHAFVLNTDQKKLCIWTLFTQWKWFDVFAYAGQRPKRGSKWLLVRKLLKPFEIDDVVRKRFVQLLMLYRNQHIDLLLT